MRPASIMLGVLLASGWAMGEVTFTTAPKAARRGGKVVISFAVSRGTDVEVGVLDPSGKVVRHLAAGVLGGAADPPAPLRAGLAQTLEWDGRDDLGKPAGEGPFEVRVRAGTRVSLGGFIGEPALLEEKVFGLATDDAGRLYAATGGGYGKNLFTIKVFDRTGRYERTIFPYAANLKPDDAGGFGKPAVRDGRLAPPQYDALLPWIYDRGLGAIVGPRVVDGVLWLTDGAGRICRIRAADGACLSWGKGAAPAPPAQGPICWAIAPGGKGLFLAGWYHQSRKIADGQVFQVDPATGERTPLLAIDVPADSFWLTERNGWYHFTNWGRKNGISALHGLAVDSAGRLYVCDRVNQRLAVYDAAGKLLGATPIEHPDQVCLSPAGPEVYVSTRKVVDGYKAVNEVTIVKLSGWKDGKVLASLTLKGSNAPSLAVDATARPAVVWLSNVGDGKGITRIEDRGGQFAVTGKLCQDVPAMPTAVVKVWADPISDDVIVSNGWSGLSRFDGLSGEAKEMPLSGIDLAFGPDGSYYVYGQKGWHELVARFGRDFQPLAFDATGKNTTSMTTTGKDVYGRYGHGWCNKGLCVGLDGRIYVYNMYDWAKYFINTWDPSGRSQKGGRVAEGLIGPLDSEGGGLAVDPAGNVYVGMHGFPKAHTGGRQTEGSVVKFAPGGGGYAPEKTNWDGIEWRGSHAGKFVEGALAAYPGLGSQVSGGCVCKEARFDVDRYGRLYVPNALDYCVRILDNAGNEAVRFGHYANADSRGPGSLVPDPAIPLGWPISVSASPRGHVYVADTLNHRVVRVDLAAEAEARCAVK